jgi:type II secretory pathway component GspD/PulD (secretin)
LFELGENQVTEEPNPNRQKIREKLQTIIPEVKFENATLKQIADFVSREYALEVVIAPTVLLSEGRASVMPPSGIDIAVKNVPLKDMLGYALKPLNLKYVVEDHAVLITPSDYLDPESLETEIFRLAAGNARAIEKSLRRSGIPWPKGTNVIVKQPTEPGPGTGTLIVTNTPNNMVLVRELVHAWDRPAPRQKGAPKAGTTLLTIISAKIVESK